MAFFFISSSHLQQYKASHVYRSPLRLCQNLDRNLEIHSVALTELDSDLHLKVGLFLNGNEPCTMYNDYR